MIQPISTNQISADGYMWNRYSPRVATISNKLHDFATVAYFQFSFWDEAHSFYKSISDKCLCGRAKVRVAERFSYGYEVKVWGMSESVLEQLVIRDCNRQPLPIRRDWSLSESFDAIQLEAVA